MAGHLRPHVSVRCLFSPKPRKLVLQMSSETEFLIHLQISHVLQKKVRLAESHTFISLHRPTQCRWEKIVEPSNGFLCL